MAQPKVINANGLQQVDLGDEFQGAPGTRVPVADNDPTRATYSCFIPAFVPAATPGDFLEIRGAAGKLTRIRQIVLTGTATAASNILLALIRRSAPDTIALNAATPLIPRDPAHDAALTTIKTASANPSAVGATALGAGFADGGRLNLAPAANGGIDRLAFQLSWLNDRALTLNGANDCLYISLAATTSAVSGPAWPAGGALDIAIWLTEEPNPQN
jgi:hypothetical protein